MQKQGLQQKQSQQLTFNNALKQSIQLLSCNQQELDIMIEQMLENNIMLDRVNQEIETVFESEDDYVGGEDIPEEIDLDFDWQDVYDPEVMEKPKVMDDVDGFQVEWLANSDSFEQNLRDAIHQSNFDVEQIAIIEAVINQVDDNYLLPEHITNLELAKKTKTSEEKVAKTIDKLKHLDPTGVGCRNIKECLLAQLTVLANQCDNDETFLNAYEILKFYFDYIVKKPSYIMDRLDIDENELAQAMELIQTLSPYPYISQEDSINQVRPDIYVHKKMGVYYASINHDNRHDLNINIAYSELAKTTKGDNGKFLKAQIQDAKFFLKALDKRYSMILKVANVIVMQQQNYFIAGVNALVPLSMSEVANILNINESTVSRAVNNKYLSFKGRLIELRYFFTQNISKAGDEEYSAEQVKQKISEIINTENKKAPFPDSKIETQLALAGFEISRRTVAKYREALGFETASKRKIK